VAKHLNKSKEAESSSLRSAKSVRASPPMNAHESIVDRGWLIEPMARVNPYANWRRGPTVGVERKLVMSHRGLVTLRAPWFPGCVRDGWAADGNTDAEHAIKPTTVSRVEKRLMMSRPLW
jgi:hypothetical protein